LTDTPGKLRIRSMTPEEFAAYRRRSIAKYTAKHVRAGTWSQEAAERRAAREAEELLPGGIDTPGMVLLVGETADAVVGLVWVGPAPQQRPGWWIYDIQVIAEQRRHGYGRALLHAAEREIERRGGDAVSLNVFGWNNAARRLYESSGYEVRAILMGRDLSP